MTALTHRRRWLVAGIIASLAVVACGSDDDGTAATSTVGTAATSPTTPSPAPTGEASETDAQRVVVLIPALLDAALAVDVRPVAAPGVGAGFAEHLGDLGDDIQLLDVTEGPNLEEITALEPDLILTQSGEGNAADQLRLIAATAEIDFPLPASTWPRYVADAAAALGRADAVADVAAEHDRVVAATAATLAPVIDGRTVSLLRFGDATVRVYGPDSFAGSVLTSAGVTLVDLPPGTTYNEQGYAEISNERLADVAGDIVLVYRLDEEDEALAEGNPLWGRLPAVVAGDAHFVPQSHWLHIGYQSAARVLDDTVGLLT